MHLWKFRFFSTLGLWGGALFINASDFSYVFSYETHILNTLNYSSLVEWTEASLPSTRAETWWSERQGELCTSQHHSCLRHLIWISVIEKLTQGSSKWAFSIIWPGGSYLGVGLSWAPKSSCFLGWVWVENMVFRDTSPGDFQKTMTHSGDQLCLPLGSSGGYPPPQLVGRGKGN